jgi:hypothetical protein
MVYLTADQLVAENLDTNLTVVWESLLDYELAKEIIGRDLSTEEWTLLMNYLDDAVFEVVESFKNEI